MMATDKRTARELIQHLRGRGVTNAEIARELQRDPRMVRKVLNGETPGTNYVQTLRELADTGHANATARTIRSFFMQFTPSSWSRASLRTSTSGRAALRVAQGDVSKPSTKITSFGSST